MRSFSMRRGRLIDGLASLCLYCKTFTLTTIAFAVAHFLLPTYYPNHLLTIHPPQDSPAIASTLAYHGITENGPKKPTSPSITPLHHFAHLILPQCQAASIPQSWAKGDSFTYREDLKKRPYIDLPSRGDYAAATTEKAGRKPFKFNPNTATQSDFVRLGFSKKQAASILKFREKGGSFTHREDFKKLYVVSEACYQRLYPYIDLPSRGNHAAAATEKASRKPFKFNPNTATQSDFVRLGFSKKQAASILKFREKVGSFTHREDFKKLYVVSEACYQRLYPYIDLPSLTRTGENAAHDTLFYFNPNTIHLDGLIRLGIAPWRARGIIQYRERGGYFYQADDLQQLRVMDSATFDRIKSYILFE